MYLSEPSKMLPSTTSQSYKTMQHNMMTPPLTSTMAQRMCQPHCFNEVTWLVCFYILFYCFFFFAFFVIIYFRPPPPSKMLPSTTDQSCDMTRHDTTSTMTQRMCQTGGDKAGIFFHIFGYYFNVSISDHLHPWKCCLPPPANCATWHDINDTTYHLHPPCPWPKEYIRLAGINDQPIFFDVFCVFIIIISVFLYVFKIIVQWYKINISTLYVLSLIWVLWLQITQWYVQGYQQSKVQDEPLFISRVLVETSLS